MLTSHDMASVHNLAKLFWSWPARLLLMLLSEHKMLAMRKPTHCDLRAPAETCRGG